MVQLNLLPDVKLNYIKTKRTKRLVIGGSVLVTVVSIALFAFMFSLVNVVQKSHLSNLDSDIKKYRKELEDVKDVNKILTVQNQLKNIDGLHVQKPVTSRLFGYVTQLTPAQANISQITLDYTATSLSITGSADSLATINKFVDTLKFTTYEATMTMPDGSKDTKKGTAFSEVVLSSFSKSDGKEKVAASYNINLKYDPVIFDSQYEVTLIVPNIVSTRSNVEKPDALFQQSGQGQ